MMLRRISDVPASIVLPRDRSCQYCQNPFHGASAPVTRACRPKTDRASEVGHWLAPGQLHARPLRARNARFQERRQRPVVGEPQRLHLDPLARDRVADHRVVGGPATVRAGLLDQLDQLAAIVRAACNKPGESPVVNVNHLLRTVGAE